MDTVLVTGGSGFVGSHVILQLLNAGYDVRTTVRSLKREPDVRAMLKNAGVDPNGRLAFFPADLERDAGWPDAVTGCDYVIHVASPIPAAAPKTEDELIRPARDGVLRVLRAARDGKVRRVVLTSSCGAIYYGHPPQTAPFDETSWTNIDGDMSAYVRSKAIAERAAWDFMSAEGGSLELSAINPAGIFGPVLGADFSSSIELVTRLMKGMPGCPRLYFGVVDVRDVADLHLRAMTIPPRAASASSPLGRHHVDARDRHGPPRTPWRRSEESADAGASELAGTRGGAIRSRPPRASSGLGLCPERADGRRQPDLRLRHDDADGFAEAVHAPACRSRPFEPFAQNQDRRGRHRDEMSAGQQHREQHQRPARPGAPQAMRHAEAKRLEIRLRAEHRKLRVRVTPIEAPLLDRRTLPHQCDEKRDNRRPI